MENLYQTPILLLIFNRMSTTVRVFEKIKAQKPKYLFIASDGSREGKENEQAEVEKIRKYVLDQIDWDCEVKTLFRDKNLGCGVAPYTAITWFFDHVEKGIILEDDCLPLPGFFEFCEEVLNYYKDDERIYEISGHNLQAGKVRGDGSYYFSNYPGIWGWASWARAWKNYDYEMRDYEDFVRNNSISKVLPDIKQRKFWMKLFNNAKKLGSWWDYQWVYTIWKNQGISIIPNANLVRNIGFDDGGTHTFGTPKWYEKAIKGSMSLKEIKHPSSISVCDDADKYLFSTTYHKTILSRIISFLKRKIRKS